METLNKKSDDRRDNPGNKKERKQSDASYNPLPEKEIKPPKPNPPARPPKPKEKEEKSGK